MPEAPTLLNTQPIRDQRTMVGVRSLEEAHRTPDEVKAAWQAWAAEHGLTARFRAGDPSRDLHVSGETVTVRIDGGKWIGSCPGCNGGIAGWPYHEQGCCLDCGTIYTLAYPDPETIRELVQLLAERPEQYRSWNPDEGGIERVRDEQAQYAAAPQTTITIDLAKLTDDERHALAGMNITKALT